MFSTARGSCFVFMALVVAMLVGCATTPPPAPETRKVEYAVPILDFEQGTTALQKKDGIVISLVPSPFEAERKTKQEERNRRMDGRGFMEAENVVGHVEVAEVPYYEITPSNLMFDVKINNQLDHILKMQGSIVTYNIDSKVVNVPQDHYSDLVNSIIPRKQEKETKIEGPPVSSLKKSGVISISIDEVPVEVNPNGTTKTTTNFEWIIAYKLKKETKEEPVTFERMLLLK